ncbi:MAG: HlyC/CorC family transporter, partial [Firmicutes bacterium]|nr:HlyC/CorC family transporter [Bacillota bacterium]
GLILCVFLSAFFSASEMALSSANRIRLENEAEEGSGRAKTALELTEDFDDSLSAILIGNNLVNIAASSIASVLVILLLGSDRYAWISTLALTVLIIIFGETIPKITAKQQATAFSLRCAPFVKLLRALLLPFIRLVVALVNLLTRGIEEAEEDDEDEEIEELQTIIETAEDEGVLDSGETEMLIAAIDFNDISAYEVMTARVDIEAVDVDDDLEDIKKQIESTPYTRIPVYEDSIDNIIGVMHLNAFLRACARGEDFDIRDLLMPPVYVYKTTRLPLVLESFKDTQQHVAIVTDEYSGTLGLLTLEDVLEVIVGDIWDENDLIEEDIVQRSESEYELDGDLPISDFLELMEIDEDDFEFDSDTVGGWCMEMLEHFPVPGEKFEYEEEGLTVTVLEAGERRVDKVLVNKTVSE